MKYRVLTDEELVHLEKDLKAFLIVNGVQHDEWAAINAGQPEKALELVELFSDTVLQIVYEKLAYIEFRSTESCLVFYCKPDEIELISLQVKPGSACDLSTPESIHQALISASSELRFFHSSKPYSESRETEIHRMLEEGCVISTEDFWNSLSQLRD